MINPEITVLDLLSHYRHAEVVFRKYDERAGECIRCNALFEPLTAFEAVDIHLVMNIKGRSNEQ